MTRPEILSEIAALTGEPDAVKWYAGRTDHQLHQFVVELRSERGPQRSTLADVWQDCAIQVS